MSLRTAIHNAVTRGIVGYYIGDYATRISKADRYLKKVTVKS